MATQVSIVNEKLTEVERFEHFKQTKEPFFSQASKTGELYLTFQNNGNLFSVPVNLQIGSCERNVVVLYNNITCHKVSINRLMESVLEHCKGINSFSNPQNVTIVKMPG